MNMPGDEPRSVVQADMHAASLAADSVLDIRADTCPMTFVRTRLALDRLARGQVLRVHLKGEEPRRNIPRTAAEQGHQVLAEQDLPGGEALVWLRRG